MLGRLTDGDGRGPRPGEGDWSGGETGATAVSLQEAEARIEERVARALGAYLDRSGQTTPRPEDVAAIRDLVDGIVDDYERSAAQGSTLPALPDAAGLVRRIVDDYTGLSILQPLMEDRTVEEILINGPNKILTVRDGETVLEEALRFQSDAALLDLVKRKVSAAGERLDDSAPYVDAQLPDGSRLNVTIPPVANQTLVTIRKFLPHARTLADLVRLDALTPDAADFLALAVRVGLTIVISGPTGSGKTTLLAALARCIESLNERLVVIELTPELQLERRVAHAVEVKARRPNIEGKGEITIRDLVSNALRQRPTRIIVGEVRGPEALDMLQAVNTGHPGSMTSAHANSARDVFSRLAVMAMMAPEQITRPVAMEMLAQTVDLVVQLQGGRSVRGVRRPRRVSEIYEVTGFDSALGQIVGQHLWALDEGSQLAFQNLPRCRELFAECGVDWTPPRRQPLEPR